MRATQGFAFLRRASFSAPRAGAWLLIVSCACLSADQPTLDKGLWKLRVASSVNGQAEPVQDTQECLGDELDDLAAYFAPALEDVKAKCQLTTQPSADPRTLAHRLQCVGNGYTVDITSSVTIESTRSFRMSIRRQTKTPKESAVVVAEAEARWTGACKAQ